MMSFTIEPPGCSNVGQAAATANGIRLPRQLASGHKMDAAVGLGKLQAVVLVRTVQE
jgi:hypothetical protein